MTGLRKLSSLKKEPKLISIISKIEKNIKLTEKEALFCLSCSILLIKEFEKDKRNTSFLEFAYYLILNYTLQSDNYHPLFDVSTNLGFYPISRFILKNGLIDSKLIGNYFIKKRLDKFDHSGITETLEQNKYRRQLIKSSSKDNCYIAPTSFGKSSMMVELISTMNANVVFIIVPTKSLLTQTYKVISSTFTDRKVIFHDEMYDNENNFIAIFTQERALRLLKSNEGICIDALLIDEAHNLFEGTSRSILLSRLIRRVRLHNKNSRVFYFSPLICDSNNLKFEEQQIIDTHKIQFNIKEADISELRLNGQVYKYNRFIDEFFEYQSKTTVFEYILNTSKENNFFYLRSPKMVEVFARAIANEIPNTQDNNLMNLALTISKNVHEDFYCVDLIKKGVLYIHGKLPDLIKEYLEYSFRKNDSIKYIIANSVILEGVNLPIDNLYILNTHSLDSKQLTNLIGRVNRLNDVFNDTSKNLAKLRPPVHFINSTEFNRKSSNMAKKIKSLRPGCLKDEIKNPTLLKFDISKYSHIIENSNSTKSINEAYRERSNAQAIIDREIFLTSTPSTKAQKMKTLFLESGLNLIYRDHDHAFLEILKNIDNSLNNPMLDPIDKIHSIFILNLEDQIVDYEFLRLEKINARDYYRKFVKFIHTLTLKQHITETVKYFHHKINKPGSKLFYIGGSYGELNINHNNDGATTYIDLSTKSNKELVNLALVKIKMESDFVSYRLNEYITLLKEYNCISEDEYNTFIYGTTKKRNAELTKLGLSGPLIRAFEIDNQLKNIFIDKHGHVTVNQEFIEYLKTKDDLINFEIKKYLSI